MRAEKEKWLAPTAAPKNESRCASYRPCARQSSSKLRTQIGELLLCLQAPLRSSQKRECWALLEARLRRHVDLKIRRAMA